MPQGMRTALAYVGVLLIWGTTPLAIQWSSEGISFLLSVSVRMSIAAVLSVAVVFVLGKSLPHSLSALLSYAAGSLGVFGAMLCVYWAAQYVPSGLVSILFGVAPVFTGVQAYYLLGEGFSVRKMFGLLLSILGLLVVFADSLKGGAFHVYAVTALLGSALLFSLCSVLVKKVAASVSPLQQTAGTLLVSASAYVVLCFLTQVQLPSEISLKTGASLFYLAGICSVLGFFLYFYVLKVSSAGSVALIALISPVIALSLGTVLNGEIFGWTLLAGAGCIALGLIAYQWPGIVGLCRRRV